MSLLPRRGVVPFLIALISFALVAPAPCSAASHLVTRKQLQQAAQTSARRRQAQIAQVEKFFSSKLARQAFRKAHLNAVEIQKAIPTLSPNELARLAARTREVQNNFAAGALSNQQITYILIALGAALLVTIIFVS